MALTRRALMEIATGGLSYSIPLSDVRVGSGDTSNVLNVRDFGATGNGRTDDYAAIQSCLDAAFGTVVSPHGNANRLLNKAVYFPAGNYLLSTPLQAQSWESPHLFGDGNNLSNITGSGCGAIVTNGCRNGRFENLSFTKGGDASQVAFALDWNSTGYVSLNHNLFLNCSFQG